MLVLPNIGFHGTIPIKITMLFQKGCRPRNCNFVMLQKWKAATDMGKCLGVLLMDLSKGFHCRPNDLPLTKVNICGFNINA